MGTSKVLAEAVGFTSREGRAKEQTTANSPLFDARSLNKSNRTVQINIAVSPATKNRFWQFAHEGGHRVGEEALLELLDFHDSMKVSG